MERTEERQGERSTRTGWVVALSGLMSHLNGDVSSPPHWIGQTLLVPRKHPLSTVEEAEHDWKHVHEAHAPGLPLRIRTGMASGVARLLQDDDLLRLAASSQHRLIPIL